MQGNELLQNLTLAVIEGNQAESVSLTGRLLESGVPAKNILDEGLLPGMDVVGVRFRENQIFVPQVLIAARAMKSSLALLEPLLSHADLSGSGTVVIGTVKGDIHDIGKNIVAMMLRSSGFRVVDLGIDVKIEKFIDAVRKEQAALLGMSALLTTTMPYMEQVIGKCRQEGLHVKIVVGGAPVSKLFAEKIGADGYARNASDAVILAKELVGIHA